MWNRQLRLGQSTKYLGKNYVIEASLGHIIDLPKSRMAVSIKEDFKPEYITVRGRAKILNRLKTLAAAANKVLLAADPDREGEAISWHLQRALQTKNPNIKRIAFNEITKQALHEAMEQPRDINLDLVNSQQARRILDRLVGYNISPLLWKKIKGGLSAGRVQSVALKQICEREAEIEKFIEEEYWTLTAHLLADKSLVKAELYSIDGKRQERDIQNEKQMQTIMTDLESKTFVISSVRESERKRDPTAPYNTSKLQQDASSKLNLSSQKTMMFAQQLYEGISLGKSGFTGLITYMRTDSTRVSPQAFYALRSYIEKEFGAQYLSEKPRLYKAPRGAQDAHEAIRPTDVSRHPDQVASFLSRDQLRLYKLIWQKYVSSQMSSEVSIYKTVEITAGNALFRATQRKSKFDGFTLVFGQEVGQKASGNVLANLTKGLELKLKKLEPKQHFTQPPPRYTDAAMVKVLEESGVGRPSTYAPTIQTLLKRYYATRIQRALKPTELGILVNSIMQKHFPRLVDMNFTAQMENELDMIAQADLNWVKMLGTFYNPFISTLKEAAEKIEDMKSLLDKPTEYVCEKCNTNMVKRLGRHGYFLACPRFPECRNAKSIPLGPCPTCEEGSVVHRATKRGRPFYGCNRYPNCDFSTWDKPLTNKCPQCDHLLFEKKATGSNRAKIAHCLKCNYQVDISLHQSA